MVGSGITTLRLQDDGRMTVSATAEARNPSFVCVSDCGRFLYSVHEVVLDILSTADGRMHVLDDERAIEQV